jgi:uncharacterized protein (TIGR00725 family)
VKKAKYRIGVMGTAGRGKQLPKELLDKARLLGEEIAKQNCVLVTGACMGIPQAAAEGADAARGLIIGFSPAAELKQHLEPPISYPYPIKNSFLVFSGMGKEGRNVLSIQNCDGVIFAGGRAGTLMEFSTAYHMGKVLGVLQGIEGIGEEIINVFNWLKSRKDTGSVLVVDSDPKKLVKRVLEAVKLNN